MSISSSKVAIALVVATAGAGAVAAAPLLAHNGGRASATSGHHASTSPQRAGGLFTTQPAHRPPTTPVSALPVQRQPATPVSTLPPAHPHPAAPVRSEPVPVREPVNDPVTRDPGIADDEDFFDDWDGEEFVPRSDMADTWLPRGTVRRRSFYVSCDQSTFGAFDPILFPGQDPAGHEHEFFGALTIDASSTPASLVEDNMDRDSTTCTQSRDGSAYWMPSLTIVDDPANPEVWEPEEIRVRYSAPLRQRVRAFPAGFTIVAGDKTATALQANAGWRCEFDRPGTPLEDAPPACEPDEAIVGVVRFPNCWDGVDLTHPTQAHMAYRKGSRCPVTHPVALPEMTQEVFWATDGDDHNFALSSGNTAGLHADFMNGWNQRTLRNQVRRWMPRGR